MYLHVACLPSMMGLNTKPNGCKLKDGLVISRLTVRDEPILIA